MKLRTGEGRSKSLGANSKQPSSSNTHFFAKLRIGVR